MPIGSLLRQSLEVRRAGATDVTVTIAGRVVPLSPADQAASIDAGGVMHDFRAFTPIADVRLTDTLTDPATGLKYEVRGVRDAAGAGHHLELDLRKVI